MEKIGLRFSLEWNGAEVMDGESGDDEEDEISHVK